MSKVEEISAPDREMVLVSFPAPLSFSVVEFVKVILERGYINKKYDYDFEGLLEVVPQISRKYANDCVAKAILSHCWGELLAKDFRTWVRSQLDESLMYEDAGASIGPDGEEL